MVANHLKSKSGSDRPPATTPTPVTGRARSTATGYGRPSSLAAFVEQLKADSGSDDVLLLGDFNAYTQEDPMQVLYDAGYTDRLDATGEASYVFSGESGSLDHALASPSLAPRVTGVDVWQINSLESYAFEYDGHPAFYAADPYRASDHNPIVVGLDTGARPAGRLQLLSINDFHGRLESPGTVGRPAGRRRGPARRRWSSSCGREPEHRVRLRPATTSAPPRSSRRSTGTTRRSTR